MPWTCFDYPADVPPGNKSNNAARGVPPGLRKMPATECFSYPGDVTPDTKIRDVARPASRHAGSKPGYPCFSYPGTHCFRY
jgi:hypothetical protein